MSAKWLTVDQACRRLGVNRVTLAAYYDRGELGGFRTGNPHLRDEFGRPGTKGARRISDDEKLSAVQRKIAAGGRLTRGHLRRAGLV